MHPEFAIPRSPHLQARYEHRSQIGAGDSAYGRQEGGQQGDRCWARALHVRRRGLNFDSEGNRGRRRLIMHGRDEIEVAAALQREGEVVGGSLRSYAWARVGDFGRRRCDVVRRGGVARGRRWGGLPLPLYL